MIKKALSTIILVTFTILLVAGCSTKTETTLNGYLIDKHCFDMKDPAKETKECLTMEKCEKSGYGIAVRQKDGKYKFYKFDDKGHKLAKELLSKTEKKDAISIVVKGEKDGDLIKAATISEK